MFDFINLPINDILRNSFSKNEQKINKKNFISEDDLLTPDIIVNNILNDIRVQARKQLEKNNKDKKIDEPRTRKK